MRGSGLLRVSAATRGWCAVTHHDGLEVNLLEGKLFSGLGEEAECKGIRFVSRAELDLDRFVVELGKGVAHFAIEDERGVGVKFFLKLEEVGFLPGPWPGFIHRQDKDIASSVVSERIKHGGMGNAFRAFGQIFGNHW